MQKLIAIIFLICIAQHSVARDSVCAHRKVAFTFDDGPRSLPSPKILEELKRQKVPATFFTVEARFRLAENDPIIEDFIREVDVNPLFDFGNHTKTHPALPKLGSTEGRAAVLAEIQALPLNRDYQRIVAKQKNEFFRAPYGATDELVLQQLKIAGYLGHVYWHVDTNDWDKRINPTPVELRAYTLQELRKACVRFTDADEVLVILMHDIHANTADALSAIISDMKVEKVDFVALDEILEGPNYSWKEID